MTLPICGIRRPGVPLLLTHSHGLFGLFRDSVKLLTDRCTRNVRVQVVGNSGSVGFNSVCRGTMTRRLITRNVAPCCCGGGGHKRLSFIVRLGNGMLPVRMGSNGSCRARQTLSGVVSYGRCSLPRTVMFGGSGLHVMNGVTCAPVCVIVFLRGSGITPAFCGIGVSKLW